MLNDIELFVENIKFPIHLPDRISAVLFVTGIARLHQYYITYNIKYWICTILFRYKQLMDVILRTGQNPIKFDDKSKY